MKLELVATCLFGLEHLLGEEIDALGYERISTIDGRVTFAGDEEACRYKLKFHFLSPMIISAHIISQHRPTVKVNIDNGNLLC